MRKVLCCAGAIAGAVVLVGASAASADQYVVVYMSFFIDPWLFNCANNPADSPAEQARAPRWPPRTPWASRRSSSRRRATATSSAVA
jgi:hypothetical protein